MSRQYWNREVDAELSARPINRKFKWYKHPRETLRYIGRWFKFKLVKLEIKVKGWFKK